MDNLLGHVWTISGTQTTVTLKTDAAGEDAIRIGALVRIGGGGGAVIGMVNALEGEPGAPQGRVLVVDLLGEMAEAAAGEVRFRRGVSRYPASGTPVYPASEVDLAAIYGQPVGAHVCVGTLYHQSSRSAFVISDELLSKHFAVIGTTGTGKSCAVTLILSAILAGHPNAHIVLLDPHNEYAPAFGELAEIINVDNLRLPFWLFNFEEACAILIRGGTPEEQEAQALILRSAIMRARLSFGSDPDLGMITVDTPVPFGAGELLRLIEEAMGKLDHPDTAVPYLRLKTRLEALRSDRQFAFMFSDWLVTRDTLAQVLSRLLRIPVAGRPLTIVDLSGVPSEVADVVVSLLSRLTFDFVSWAGQGQMPPVLLVCEEAHRYVPADERHGFAATARAIGRIAKEGRKYGVSLALISQRPSELSAEALSQCGTVFSLRLAADLDQHFVAAALPDAARGMLASLPSLGPQEAIVCGEGVSLPMRIRFDDLPSDRRPRSASARFSQAWQRDAVDIEFLNDKIRGWRQQRRRPLTAAPAEPG